MGVDLNACLFEQTRVHWIPDVIPVLLTHFFPLKTQIVTFLHNLVDDVMTVSSEDAYHVQWYDSIQLWYLFRQTPWQQDMSLSKAFALSIPSQQNADLLTSEVRRLVSKTSLVTVSVNTIMFTQPPLGYFTFQHQNSSHLPNLLVRRERLIDEHRRRKGQDKLGD